MYSYTGDLYIDQYDSLDGFKSDAVFYCYRFRVVDTGRIMNEWLQ